MSSGRHSLARYQSAAYSEICLVLSDLLIPKHNKIFHYRTHENYSEKDWILNTIPPLKVVVCIN